MELTAAVQRPTQVFGADPNRVPCDLAECGLRARACAEEHRRAGHALVPDGGNLDLGLLVNDGHQGEHCRDGEVDVRDRTTCLVDLLTHRGPLDLRVRLEFVELPVRQRYGATLRRSWPGCCNAVATCRSTPPKTTTW